MSVAENGAIQHCQADSFNGVVSRRQFLRFVILGSASILAGGCNTFVDNSPPESRTLSPSAAAAQDLRIRELTPTPSRVPTHVEATPTVSTQSTDPYTSTQRRLATVPAEIARYFNTDFLNNWRKRVGGSLLLVDYGPEGIMGRVESNIGSRLRLAPDETEPTFDSVPWLEYGELPVPIRFEIFNKDMEPWIVIPHRLVKPQRQLVRLGPDFNFNEDGLYGPAFAARYTERDGHLIKYQGNKPYKAYAWNNPT